MYQINEAGERELIQLTSGLFSEVNKTRTTYDCELEAAYLAVKKLRRYLEANTVILYTDNQNLVNNLKKFRIDASGKELKKLNTIKQYIAEVIHLPGSRNGLADYLSRDHNYEENQLENKKNGQLNQITRSELIRREKIQKSYLNNIYLGYAIDIKAVILSQEEDIWCKQLKESEKYRRRLIRVGDVNYMCWFKTTINNEKLICVPEKMQNHVIRGYHSIFHPGTK
jgi:ribonuclease HI